MKWKQVNPISMKGKLRFLLLSLVLLLFLYPYLENSYNSFLLNMIFSLILILSIVTTSYDRNHLIIGLLLGVPTLILNWLNPSFFVISHILTILFYTYTAAIILFYLLKSEKITKSVLFGSFSVYILMGITFASLFSLIYYVNPDSFNVQTLTGSEVLYYSFSTMTTLGVGDILPVTSQARSLSIIEVVAGQMYLTIIVAKLVGMSIVQARNKK